MNWFHFWKVPLSDLGNRGREIKDNQLPYLRRDAHILTGHDKAAGCRALAGRLQEGGVSCFQHCGVLSAHRTQQPPQSNHLAQHPGTGPGHFTMQLSSGRCFGSWATANGKNKTAHTGDKKPWVISSRATWPCVPTAAFVWR